MTQGREPRSCRGWVRGLSSCQGAQKSLLPCRLPDASLLQSLQIRSLPHSLQARAANAGPPRATGRRLTKMKQNHRWYDARVDWAIETYTPVDEGKQKVFGDGGGT